MTQRKKNSSLTLDCMFIVSLMYFLIPTAILASRGEGLISLVFGALFVIVGGMVLARIIQVAKNYFRDETTQGKN